jgi:hypothetical protein
VENETHNFANTGTIDQSTSDIGAIVRESLNVRGIFAAVTAMIGWLALGLLLYAVLRHSHAHGSAVAHVLSFYFSFFTVLTNILVALVLSVSLFATDPKSAFLRSDLQSAVAVYIAVVGLVDFLFLDGIGKARGLDLAAECMLHAVIPILYLIYWITFVPKGTLIWFDPFLWLVYPFAYFGYILLRGAIINDYPYAFIDAGNIGYERVFLNGAELLLVFVALGLLAVAIDHWIGQSIGRA